MYSNRKKQNPKNSNDSVESIVQIQKKMGLTCCVCGAKGKLLAPHENAQYICDDCREDKPKKNVIVSETPHECNEQVVTTDFNNASITGLSFCPYCRSSRVVVGQKGYSVGKGLAGAVLAGPIGLVGGLIGSTKCQSTCLNCGKHF